MSRMKLNEKFEELKDDLKKLDELNEELENKNDMDMMGLEEEVDEEMEKAVILQEGDNEKASESQNKASQKMQEMSQMMANMAGAAGTSNSKRTWKR